MGKVFCKIAGAVFTVNVIAFAADFNIQAANTYVTEGTSDTENDENTYTIQYELNGGTNNEENPSSYTAGEGVASLKLATKFEHNFEGWYLDAALQNKVEGISEDISGDVILYAKWSLYN